MTINDVYVLYVEHGEDTDNAADTGDADCVHQFIGSFEMSPVHKM